MGVKVLTCTTRNPKVEHRGHCVPAGGRFRSAGASDFAIAPGGGTLYGRKVMSRSSGHHSEAAAALAPRFAAARI
jgi:hypothetical protein